MFHFLTFYNKYLQLEIFTKQKNNLLWNDNFVWNTRTSLLIFIWITVKIWWESYFNTTLQENKAINHVETFDYTKKWLSNCSSHSFVRNRIKMFLKAAARDHSISDKHGEVIRRQEESIANVSGKKGKKKIKCLQALLKLETAWKKCLSWPIKIPVKMKELAEILLAFVLNRFPTKRSKVVILKATSLVRRIGTKR